MLSCTHQCPTMTVIQYESVFYLYSDDKLKPLLINLQPNTNITCESVVITNTIIDQILNQDKDLTLPFNVKLYSSYCYIRHQAQKKIQQNIIGIYCDQKNKNTLHLFVSPTLQKYNYHLNTLELPDNTSFYTKNTMCSIQHLPEGHPLLQNKRSSKVDKETLNQDHCICEHPATQRVFLTSKKTLYPLGRSFE